jgi:hypothetical protein
MKIVKTCSICDTFFVPITDLVAEDLCQVCTDNDGGFGLELEQMQEDYNFFNGE